MPQEEVVTTEFDDGWEEQDQQQPDAEDRDFLTTGLPGEVSEDVQCEPWEEDAEQWGDKSAEVDSADPLLEYPLTSPQDNDRNGTGIGAQPGRDAASPARKLGWDGLRKRRGLVKPDEVRPAFSPHERLLILDTWQRSGLPAGDFAPLVGLSKHTLYLWKKRFTRQGPAGLMEHPRGASSGSKLPEVTKRTIVMLKQLHPEWGCQRISDELLRGPALAAGAAAVARVLHEAGYQMEEHATRPHPDKVRRFERARPNQLWQTDLFTFILKRQNRRLYLVAFMDDHSRFLTGYGLHASASGAFVLEVLRAAMVSYGPPEEILTDNGPQYVTWRGKSQFSRELEQQGIRQVVSRPKHPQTLGKIERFWGTLWRECVQRAVFLDLEDARRRVGLFIDYYNFRRPHQGLEGLTPADRFFHAAPAVLQTLKERVAANALDLARHGVPKPPFYMTGQVAGQPFSVHAEGERVFLSRPGQPRQEVELVGPPAEESSPAVTPPAAESLPEPVCPQGVPESEVPCSEPLPGVSWYETAPPLAGVEDAPPADPLPGDPAASEEGGPHADQALGGAS
jgi:transposase InsO family protein